MRKFLFTLIFIFSLHSCAFAFASSDTQLIISKLEGINQRIDAVNQRIDDLNKRVDDFQASTEKEFAKVYKHIDDKIADVKQYVDVKIDGVYKHIDDKIDGVKLYVDAKIESVNAQFKNVENRIDDLKLFITLGIAVLGLVLAHPIYGPTLKKFYESHARDVLTIDDLEKYLSRRETLKNSNNQPG